MTTFTPSSGNVYADLGYADPEGMRATSALVMQLQDLIGDRPLATIATRIDLPEPNWPPSCAGTSGHTSSHSWQTTSPCCKPRLNPGQR